MWIGADDVAHARFSRKTSLDCGERKNCWSFNAIVDNDLAPCPPHGPSGVSVFADQMANRRRKKDSTLPTHDANPKREEATRTKSRTLPSTRSTPFTRVHIVSLRTSNPFSFLPFPIGILFLCLIPTRATNYQDNDVSDCHKSFDAQCSGTFDACHVVDSQGLGRQEHPSNLPRFYRKAGKEKDRIVDTLGASRIVEAILVRFSSLNLSPMFYSYSYDRVVQ